MDINQALIRKLKESSYIAESAWREDIDQLHKAVDPIGGTNINDIFKSFVNLTISFIKLKKTLINKSLQDNLDVKLTGVDYKKLLTYVTKELSSDNYLTRFSVFKRGVEISYSRYGIKFEYDLRLIEASFIAGVKNTSSRVIADLNADFKLIENKLKISTSQHINDVVDLKPNIAGIGLNLNALFSKLKR